MLTSGAGGTSQVIAAMFFVFVFALYVAFRRLRVHAAASRLVAIGRPDLLTALVERELPRRLTAGTRAPLHVFAAMGHNLQRRLRGGPPRPRDVGDQAGQEGAAELAALVGRRRHPRPHRHRRLAGARASYERTVEPYSTRPSSGGIELIAIECEARIKLAEGNPVRARDADRAAGQGHPPRPRRPRPDPRHPRRGRRRRGRPRDRRHPGRQGPRAGAQVQPGAPGTVGDWKTEPSRR